MRIFFIIALLVSTTGCLHLKVNQSAAIPSVTLAGQTFTVEIAQTGQERAQGLSGRDPLGEDSGMLFIFDQPAVYPFWMKDMKFPLDIIWIDNSRVVDIWANAPAPTSADTPLYSPGVAASYVLEVAAGFVDESNLKIGDPVRLDLE
jgi:uncharacterized protein